MKWVADRGLGFGISRGSQIPFPDWTFLQHRHEHTLLAEQTAAFAFCRTLYWASHFVQRTQKTVFGVGYQVSPLNIHIRWFEMGSNEARQSCSAVCLPWVRCTLAFVYLGMCLGTGVQYMFSSKKKIKKKRCRCLGLLATWSESVKRPEQGT